MKNGKYFLFLLLFTVVFSVVGVANEQFLRNPTFEPGKNNRPEAWDPSTWAGKTSLDISKLGHKDSASVIIFSTTGTDAAWSQRVSIRPFGYYKLSGWIKTDGVTPTSGQGALLNVHDIHDAQTRPLTGTKDWTYVECTFENDTIDSVQINCLFGGWGQASGKAWFDDVQLELLEMRDNTPKVVPLPIQIDTTKTGEPISKYIYGQFIEHMGQCIYGGIWAEMLEDRKFFFPVPAEGDIWFKISDTGRVLHASPWKIIGDSAATQMTTENPLSGKHSLKITPNGKIAGVYQDELVLTKGKSYTGRIVLRGDITAGPVQVRLAWGDSDMEKQTVTIKTLPADYDSYNLKYTAGADSDNARLEIVGLGKGSFVVGTVSLMPADNVNGFRKDTLELLKELNAPIYRWPGGNFVSGYDWRDGLGERDRRPTRSNPAWTGIETNDVGMHEFIELCKLINTEPMIAVNTGFGDAYSAAAEVEYANGSTDTPMGKWRAQNGQKNPFKVKWWCVGNEMWGDWQLGYMKLDQYVHKHNWVEEKMRQVDPTIKTVGSGDVGTGWSEGMLRHCTDHMDLLSEHFYCQIRPGLTAHVRQVPDAIKAKADAHRQFRKDIPGLKDKDIRVAMDEWNYWYGPHLYGELGTRYYMKDALGIAAGLHEYFRNSDIFFMANYAQTVNVIGCIKTTKTAAAFDVTAYPLILYRRQFGTIPVAVEGSGENFDVVAALTEDKKYLTIGIVNATYDTGQLSLNIKDMTIAGKAEGWVFANNDAMAYNEPGKAPTTEIKPLPPTDFTDKVFVQPISVTVFRIPVK